MIKYFKKTLFISIFSIIITICIQSYVLGYINEPRAFFSFHAIKGNSNPPVQNIHIFNDWSSRKSRWSMNSDIEWLKLSSTSGILRDLKDIDIAYVSVNIDNLDPGDYEGIVILTDFISDSFISEFEIGVSLTVSESGESPTSLVSFDKPITYRMPTNPMSLAVADFNNDTNLDIAVVTNNGKMESLDRLLPYYDGKRSNSYLVVLLGDGNGNFIKEVKSKAGVNSVDMSVGDYNGDGITDIAVANAGIMGDIKTTKQLEEEKAKIHSQKVAIFSGILKNGQLSYKRKNIKPTKLPVNITAVDLNSDGKDELLTLEDRNNAFIYASHGFNRAGDFKLRQYEKKG